MTKTHHPHSRAERLKLKKDNFESKKDPEHSSKVRRKLYKEHLVQQEAEDDYRLYTELNR